MSITGFKLILSAGEDPHIAAYLKKSSNHKISYRQTNKHSNNINHVLTSKSTYSNNPKTMKTIT